ncbi:Nucleotide-binding universal stress protein, UspA family [Marinospirillum celere]|uniref:Nucleotide-binding universal stress protein, UspA family n=1 Tax=Marinospirillum celere TaxID=1122252 RepID=A0A1I1EUE6_9GAMM|nr:universal stress protein [Marinospirillum celere]SFB89148.1 Nucleotide-binding universal stress protein, UspA family [Marinospirillum celere]
MFKRILLPVDISEGKESLKAIEAAVELAASHQAVLHLLTVLPGFGSPVVASYFPRQDMDKALAAIYQQLHDLVEPHILEGLEVKLRAVEGKPYKQILKEAKRIHADLIVIPSHGPKAVERFFLGSTAARVVERAEVSVMVIRQ